jgi:hypothetical protein
VDRPWIISMSLLDLLDGYHCKHRPTGKVERYHCTVLDPGSCMRISMTTQCVPLPIAVVQFCWSVCFAACHSASHYDIPVCFMLQSKYFPPFLLSCLIYLSIPPMQFIRPSGVTPSVYDQEKTHFFPSQTSLGKVMQQECSSLPPATSFFFRLSIPALRL